jgi:hypothetical protein
MPTILLNCHHRGSLRAAFGSLIVAAAVILSSPAVAEPRSGPGLDGVGPFLGIGFGPEQVQLGIRFGLGQLSNRLDLRSGIEAGVGDNFARGAFQIDALYRFRERWDVWQPYAGGGLSVGVTGHDRRGDDDIDVDPGLNFAGGVSKGVRSDDLFQAEIRIGIGEAPDLSFSVGWLFR